MCLTLKAVIVKAKHFQLSNHNGDD